MKWLVVLILSYSSVAGAGEIDVFLEAYLKSLADGRSTGLNEREEFRSQLGEDAIDFKACARKSCSIRMRKQPSMRGEIGDVQTWEAHFDIYADGKRLLRRSGCYLIEKTARGLYLKDYIYECYAK